MTDLRTAVAADPAPVFPLSRAQSAFWAEEMLSGRCNVLSFGVDFDRSIDVDHLDRSMTAVVVRHPLLRARFASGPTGASMAIEAPPRSVLARLSTSTASLEEWCARPLGLHCWPPLRAAVAVGESRTRLRIVAHHAVFDGESKDVFLRDLVNAYRGQMLAPPAPSLRSAPFWRALLDRTERAALTHDSSDEVETAQTHSMPPLSMRDPDSRGFVVDARLLALVGATSHRLGISKFTVHLAGWHAALARLGLGDADIVTPVAVSTREARDATEIGPFVNEIPVRSTAPSTATFRSLALDLAEGVRRVKENRLRSAATLGGTPGSLPELAVSYRRDTLGSLMWPDAAATPVRLPPLTAPGSDVVVRMIHHGPTTSGVVDVGSSQLPQGYALLLERCWRALLRAGAQRPDTPIAELPLQEAQ